MEWRSPQQLEMQEVQGSLTTTEKSAPGDHAGHGLAEREVELVGGT